MPDVPASSELRSEEDNSLVSRSKLYNEAFAQKDTSRISALIEPTVVYHADKVTLVYKRRTLIGAVLTSASDDLDV